MAWEKRKNGRQYYYRSRRLNGRVIKDYFGRGPYADLAALQFEARKHAAAEHQLHEQSREKLTAAEDATKACRHAVPGETTAMNATTHPLPPEVAERVLALEAQRQAGDRSGDAELIQLIQQYPQLAATTGDLSRQAIAAWLNLTAGADGVFRAALEQRLEYLRGRFPVGAGDQAGQMIVDRVLATWLQMAYADGRMAQTQNLDRADMEFLAKRQQQAQKQHLAAIQSWRQWQRLVGDLSATNVKPAPSSADHAPVSGSEEPVILPFQVRAKSA